MLVLYVRTRAALGKIGCGMLQYKSRPFVFGTQRSWLIVALTMLFAGCDNSGLSKQQRDPVYKAHEQAAKKCNAKWRDQPRVPIRGSHYVLDATRLPWELDGGLWAKDEECGAATIDDLFYWTGKEIISQKLWVKSGRKLTEIPQDSLGFHIIALLGASPDRARHCEAHPEDCKSRFLGPAVEWPPELVVRLKHYEDLEVRMPKTLTPKIKPEGIHSMAFFLRGWPREDGLPRVMSCDIGRDVYKITREEIENLNFGKQTKPCQFEFGNFIFKGGSAQVRTGTEALSQIVPALRALHQYFNQAITGE